MSEHLEQVALIEYCNLMANSDPRYGLIFAIPNGGHRYIKTAGKLKAEGVKAGVPDLFLPVPVAYQHGLFIEMKHGKNKPSGHQTAWLNALKEQGYVTAVCYGFEQAQDVLDRYLAGTYPPF